MTILGAWIELKTQWKLKFHNVWQVPACLFGQQPAKHIFYSMLPMHLTSLLHALLLHAPTKKAFVIPKWYKHPHFFYMEANPLCPAPSTFIIKSIFSPLFSAVGRQCFLAWHSWWIRGCLQILSSYAGLSSKLWIPCGRHLKQSSFTKTWLCQKLPCLHQDV